ncbi:hypothetical protein ACJRO7_031161 [Eucalyptus globulus]|uniref:PGG domain-containing protein n=1 Tax=Eucalyptus globulus TaxID=34317 RepID=A0ABD3JH59_EUCGL
MDGDHVSINIGDHEIWEQRRARLKALESVNGTQLPAEFKYLTYRLLHPADKEGNVDKFIETLEDYSREQKVSLSDIINGRGPSGNSLFHIAAGIENADILRALLEVIPDKRLAAEANHRGDTALHVAARAGRTHSAELLLGCGSIVPMANDGGNTALHEAVKNGYSRLTSLLLSRGSRAVYPENKEGKCPLYLAVETGNLEILKLLMEAMDENEVPWSRMQGMSPVHGAVVHRKLEMLEEMSERKRELFESKDAQWGTPLHLASSMNYVDGVDFLVQKFAWSTFEGDEEGYLPIHVACKMGHLKTIKVLLQHWPDPEELLNLKEGQNILHVAAKYGRLNVVSYIVDNLHLKTLTNAKDKEGNTPVHVATLQLEDRILTCLVTENDTNLHLVNNGNMTALDLAHEQCKKNCGELEKKICTTLEYAGAPGSVYKAICLPKRLHPVRDVKKPPPLDKLKEVANSRMVVATLITAMTFAAGFSVPGGYNSSEPDAGIATLLSKSMYDVFVICNTIALYSSITAVVILLDAQMSTSRVMGITLIRTRLPLLIALATMSLAFMAGVYVTTSKRIWIAIVALFCGIPALSVISNLFIVFYRDIPSKVIRFCPFWARNLSRCVQKSRQRRMAARATLRNPRRSS